MRPIPPNQVELGSPSLGLFTIRNRQLPISIYFPDPENQTKMLRLEWMHTTNDRQIIHKTRSNSHLPVMRHILDVLVGDNSSILVANSENMCKNLIDRLTAYQIEKYLLAALDPAIERVCQFGSLDFDTLQSLTTNQCGGIQKDYKKNFRDITLMHRKR